MPTTRAQGRKSETKPGTAGAPSRGKAKAGPGVAKASAPPPVDVTQPRARKALLALYPKPLNELFVDASPEAQKAAERYLEAHAEAKAAEAAKEEAGNVLCAAIGGNLGVRGDGFQAAWGEKDGSVDWKAIAIAKGATEADIAAHRGESTRVLNVRAAAEA